MAAGAAGETSLKESLMGRPAPTIMPTTPSWSSATPSGAIDLSCTCVRNSLRGNTKGYSSTYLAMGFANVRAGTWYPKSLESAY